MTRDEMAQTIDDITAKMKGPLGNLERHMLYLDRQELRQELMLIDCRTEAKVDALFAAGDIRGETK